MVLLVISYDIILSTCTSSYSGILHSLSDMMEYYGRCRVRSLNVPWGFAYLGESRLLSVYFSQHYRSPVQFGRERDSHVTTASIF